MLDVDCKVSVDSQRFRFKKGLPIKLADSFLDKLTAFQQGSDFVNMRQQANELLIYASGFMIEVVVHAIGYYAQKLVIAGFHKMASDVYASLVKFDKQFEAR